VCGIARYLFFQGFASRRNGTFKDSSLDYHFF
jgi:hypothetical protein